MTPSSGADEAEPWTRAQKGFPSRDPTRQGMLGDRLRRRFQRLPVQARQQMVDIDSFTDAFSTALRAVTGRAVHAVHGGGGGLAGRPEDRAVAFLLDHDQYASVYYEEFAEAHWRSLDTGMTEPPQNRRRSTYLHSMLRSVKPGTKPVSELLRGVNDEEGLRIQRVDGRYALALYWQANIDAGHSSEAVTMMLALTLTPATLSHVRFPEHGPPVVDG